MRLSEKAKPLGTLPDLSLCDFTAYAVGIRADAAIERSQHVGFLNDLAAFRLLIRLDGQPTLDKPIAPLTGPTMSPFVTLL